MTAVPDSPAPAAEKPSFFQKYKLWIILGSLFLVSNLSIFLYQRHLQNNLRAECKAIVESKNQTARAMTLQRSEEIAANLCRTLVFGLRGQMEWGNKGEIDQFLNKMVQESGLDLIIVQNDQDSIYLSTDKKYENHKVPYIQGVVTEQQILHSDLQEVVIAAPIMGTEKRLGTCLLVYKAPAATDELMAKMVADSLKLK